MKSDFASMDFSAFMASHMGKDHLGDEDSIIERRGSTEDFLIRLAKDEAANNAANEEFVETSREKDASKEFVGTGREKDEEADLRSEKKKKRMRPSGVDVGLLVVAREAKALEEAALKSELEEDEEVTKRAFPWGWVVMVVTVLLVVGILGVLVQGRDSENFSEGIAEQADEISESAAATELDAEEVLTKVTSAVESFLAADSVEEMLKYVRHPERVKPLMIDHYTRNPLIDPDGERETVLRPLTIGSKAIFWGLSYVSEGIRYEKMIVEKADGKEAKIDWETFVIYQPMDWDTFAKKRPEGDVFDFRVYASADNFFTHEFADESKFLCLRLSAPDSEEILYGYVPKASSLALEIFESFRARRRYEDVPMILRLRVPEGAVSPRGLEVVELCSPRWIYVDSPED